MIREIVAALRAMLSPPEWTGAPVFWPNEQHVATQGEPWVSAEIMGSGARNTVFNSAGKRAATDEAMAFFHIFVENGKGVGPAYEIAEQIAAVLRTTTIKTASGVIATGAPLIGSEEPGDDEGMWFRVSLSIPLTAHYAV